MEDSATEEAKMAQERLEIFDRERYLDDEIVRGLHEQSTLESERFVEKFLKRKREKLSCDDSAIEREIELRIPTYDDLDCSDDNEIFRSETAECPVTVISKNDCHDANTQRELSESIAIDFLAQWDPDRVFIDSDLEYTDFLLSPESGLFAYDISDFKLSLLDNHNVKKLSAATEQPTQKSPSRDASEAWQTQTDMQSQPSPVAGTASPAASDTSETDTASETSQTRNYMQSQTSPASSSAASDTSETDTASETMEIQTDMQTEHS